MNNNDNLNSSDVANVLIDQCFIFTSTAGKKTMACHNVPDHSNCSFTYPTANEWWLNILHK